MPRLHHQAQLGESIVRQTAGDKDTTCVAVQWVVECVITVNWRVGFFAAVTAIDAVAIVFANPTYGFRFSTTICNLS